MAVLGEGLYIVRAEVSGAIQPISQVDKVLEELGVTATETNGLLVATFKGLQSSAASFIPVLTQANVSLERVTQRTREALREVQQFQKLQLPAARPEIPQEIRSNDLLVELFRKARREGEEWGDALTGAAEEVSTLIRGVEQEASRLLAVQRHLREAPMVGPVAIEAIKLLDDRLAEVRKTLTALGVSARDVNRVFEAAAAFPELSGPEGQLFDTAAFRDTGPLLERQRQQLEALNEVRLDGVQQSFDDLIQKEKEAASQFEALRQSLSEDIAGVEFEGDDFDISGVSGADNALKQLSQAQLEAAGTSKKFATAELEIIETTKRLESALITLIAAQKKGIIGPQATPQIQQLRQQLEAAGLEVNKFGRVLGKAGEGGKVAGFLRNLSGAFDRFGQSIEDATGIAESDIAILLGAGLAGGFAGVIRIVQKAVAAFSEFRDEVNKLNADIERGFKDSAAEIRDFAATSAHDLGVSTLEAQKVAVAAAETARQMRFTADETAEFAKATILASGAIEAFVPGIHTSEEAAKLFTAAVTGSEEALKQLSITITDLNEASQSLFGKGFGQLSEAQQDAARLAATGESVGDAYREAGRETQTLGDTLRNIKGAAIEFFTESDLKRIIAAEDIITDLSELREKDKFVEGDLRDLRHEIVGLGEDELLQIRRQADFFIQNKEIRIATKKVIDEELKALRGGADAVKQQALSAAELEEIHKRDLETFRNRIDLQRQARDAQRALDEAIFDGNRRVEDAEIRIQRTREDNARKRRDLEIQSSRAIEDAITRVESAQLELIDNQNDAQDRLEDAIDRISDARKEAFRELRGFNERIADLERDHARKVEDAQDRVADAHKNAAKSITEAEIAMQQAFRQGDEQAFNAAARQVSANRQDSVVELARLEKDLAREQEDFEREIGRLRRDRDEARLDGIEAIRRAERDRARAERDNLVLIEKAQIQLNQALREEIRAREDAIRAMNDLEVEQNRALRDAKRAFEEAEIARDRAVNSAIRAFTRLAEKIGLTIDEILSELGRLQVNEMLPIAIGTIGLLPGGGRHAGGPTTPFHSYVVGERGPELFVPGQYGSVVPNWKLMQLLQQLLERGFTQPIPGQGLAGGQRPATFNVYESVDPRTTAFTISRLLATQVNN